MRSDTETRFIRLSPLTQFIGVTGSAMLLGWTIVSSAILLMHSLGAGDLREQALREQAWGAVSPAQPWQRRNRQAHNLRRNRRNARQTHRRADTQCG
ncbi:MAG: DUF5930 domain-containing protein [Pseudomonadota bacterium]